jgi:phage FluMu protein Com
MAKERLRCGWCGDEIVAAEAKVSHFKNDYGTVIERECPRCNKLLAAYLEEEGEFLAEMRNF